MKRHIDISTKQDTQTYMHTRLDLNPYESSRKSSRIEVIKPLWEPISSLSLFFSWQNIARPLISTSKRISSLKFKKNKKKKKKISQFCQCEKFAKFQRSWKEWETRETKLTFSLFSTPPLCSRTLTKPCFVLWKSAHCAVKQPTWCSNKRSCSRMENCLEMILRITDWESFNQQNRFNWIITIRTIRAFNEWNLVTNYIV